MLQLRVRPPVHSFLGPRSPPPGSAAEVTLNRELTTLRRRPGSEL